MLIPKLILGEPCVVIGLLPAKRARIPRRINRVRRSGISRAVMPLELSVAMRTFTPEKVVRVKWKVQCISTSCEPYPFRSRNSDSLNSSPLSLLRVTLRSMVFGAPAG